MERPGSTTILPGDTEHSETSMPSCQLAPCKWDAGAFRAARIPADKAGKHRVGANGYLLSFFA